MENIPENLKEVWQSCQNLKTGFLIAGGPNKQAYGNLSNVTLCVWTTREKAQEFINKNLDPEDEEVLDWKIEEIYGWAISNGFKTILFDFTLPQNPPYVCKSLTGLRFHLN